MVKLKKVPGSSLVEVVVAMVIFVLILSLSLTIIVRLSISGNTVKKLRCDMLVADYAFRTKLEKRFLDEHIQIEAIMLSKRVSNFQKELLLLEISAITPEGDTLTNYKELIYEPN